MKECQGIELDDQTFGQLTGLNHKVMKRNVASVGHCDRTLDRVTQLDCPLHRTARVRHAWDIELCKGITIRLRADIYIHRISTKLSLRSGEPNRSPSCRIRHVGCRMGDARIGVSLYRKRFARHRCAIGIRQDTDDIHSVTRLVNLLSDSSGIHIVVGQRTRQIERDFIPARVARPDGDRRIAGLFLHIRWRIEYPQIAAIQLIPTIFTPCGKISGIPTRDLIRDGIRQLEAFHITGQGRGLVQLRTEDAVHIPAHRKTHRNIYSKAIDFRAYGVTRDDSLHHVLVRSMVVQVRQLPAVSLHEGGHWGGRHLLGRLPHVQIIPIHLDRKRQSSPLDGHSIALLIHQISHLRLGDGYHLLREIRIYEISVIEWITSHARFVIRSNLQYQGVDDASGSTEPHGRNRRAATGNILESGDIARIDNLPIDFSDGGVKCSLLRVSVVANRLAVVQHLDIFSVKLHRTEVDGLAVDSRSSIEVRFSLHQAIKPLVDTSGSSMQTIVAASRVDEAYIILGCVRTAV